MLVRRANLEDAAKMADVIRRSIVESCVADHKNDAGYIGRWTANKTPEGVAAWFARGVTRLFVVELDGALVAVGGAKDQGEIALNYVAPEAQRRGVGAALMREMETYLRRQGVLLAWVSATKTAEAFYAAMGYKVFGAQPDGYGPGESALMRRALADLEVTWPQGWWGIDDPEHRRLFAEELASELGEGHILYGLKLTPIARADGRDDYLFQCDDGRVAEVHLTFANRPETPPWPGSALFAGLEEWMKVTRDEPA